MSHNSSMFVLIAILVFLRIETVSLFIIPNGPQQPNIAAAPPMPEVMVQPVFGPPNGASSAGGPTVNLPQVPSINFLQPLLASAAKPLASASNFAGNAAQPGPSYPFGLGQNGPSNAGKWDKQLENEVWPNKTAVNLYAYYLEAFHEAKAFYNRHMPSYEEEKKAFLHFVRKTHDNIERDMEEKLGLKGIGNVGNGAKIIPPGAGISIGQARGDDTIQRPQISATLENPQPMNPSAPIQNMRVINSQKPFSQNPIGPSIPKKSHILKDKVAGGKESRPPRVGSSSTTSAKMTVSGGGARPSEQADSQSSLITLVGGTTTATAAVNGRREPLSM